MNHPDPDNRPTLSPGDERHTPRITRDLSLSAEEAPDVEHEVYTSVETEEEAPGLPAEEPSPEGKAASPEPPPEAPVEEPPPKEEEPTPEAPMPPVHYAITPRPMALPPRAGGMGLLAWLLLSLTLMLTLVSFTLTSILLYRLYQVQQVATEMLDNADQTLARLEAQETMVFPYHFQGTVPFQGDIPFKQKLEFPFKGTVPIKTTVQVETVLGTITVPIDTSVPVDTKVPVDLDITVPVSTEVEIDQVIEVPIRLNESPIKDIFSSLHHWLDEMRGLFG